MAENHTTNLLAVALTLALASSTQTPTRIVRAQPRQRVQQTYQTAPPLDGQQRMWFENAIDRILRGD